MTENVQHLLDENTSLIEGFFLDFSEKDLNHKPADDKWSALENLEHMFMLEKAVEHLFIGKTESTERNPGEKSAEIEHVFNKHHRLYTSPEMLHPKGMFKTAKEAVEAIKQVRQSILEKGKDSWNDLCLDFGHFFFDKMTKAEWVYLCVHHTNRHIALIRNSIEA